MEKNRKKKRGFGAEREMEEKPQRSFSGGDEMGFYLDRKSPEWNGVRKTSKLINRHQKLKPKNKQVAGGTRKLCSLPVPFDHLTVHLLSCWMLLKSRHTLGRHLLLLAAMARVKITVRVWIAWHKGLTKLVLLLMAWWWGLMCSSGQGPSPLVSLCLPQL